MANRECNMLHFVLLMTKDDYVDDDDLDKISAKEKKSCCLCLSLRFLIITLRYN